MGPFDAKSGSDRFSTCDEIRAALSCMPDSLMESAKDELWEVESDMGGHVLIETGDTEMLTMLEPVDPTVN
jgi:hypothetical protein